MKKLLALELGRCGLVQRGGPDAADFENSIDVWEEAFAGKKEPDLQQAFREWRRVSRFYPTPADILTIAAGDGVLLPELTDAELARRTGYDE